MKNPWLKFKDSNVNFFPEDKQVILKFNKTVPPEYKIDTACLPVPFVGNPFKARIILLQLNPSLDHPPGLIEKKDFTLCRFPKLKKDNLKNNKMAKLKYPFYELNPDFRLCGGFRYWLRVLTNFIKRKTDYLKISKLVCCIEFFPYHSKKYKPLGKILKCQEYNFYLVKKAVERKAVIVLMRGEKSWLKYVPQLKNCNYLSLKSKRNVVLSTNNVRGNFTKLSAILK